MKRFGPYPTTPCAVQRDRCRYPAFGRASPTIARHAARSQALGMQNPGPTAPRNVIAAY